MPSILEAWQRHKFTMESASNLLEAYLDPKRPEGTYPWQKVGLVAVPTLIGEPGIGKTQIHRQLARRLGLDYRDSQVGARAFEDVLGIPGREEDPNNPGHHIVLAPPEFPSDSPRRGKYVAFVGGEEQLYDGPEDHLHQVEVEDDDPLNPGHKRKRKGTVVVYSGYGLYFHDELMTADPDKQNQIRDMVENRRVGMLKMAEGWFQSAATNPPTRGFVTVKRMDRAVEDRLLFIPMQPMWYEAVGYWEANNIVPELLVRYVMWRKGEGFWGGKGDEATIGARRWVMIGDIIQNLQRHGASDRDIREAIAINLTPEHATEFDTFMKVGEDPTAYPLRPSDILNPDKTDENIKIMKAWKADGAKSVLLSSSIMTLRSWAYQAREKPDFTLEDAQLDSLARFMSREVLELDQIQDLLTVFGSSSVGPDLVIRMDTTEEVLSSISFATDVAEGKAKLK